MAGPLSSPGPWPMWTEVTARCGWQDPFWVPTTEDEIEEFGQVALIMYVGHNYISHNYMGHTHVGHDYTVTTISAIHMTYILMAYIVMA